MTRILPLLAALGLSACAAAVVVPINPGTGDACGASALQAFVGQPPSALDAVRLIQPVRIIRPGDAVTMDFREDRINFELDGQDRIARVYCG